MTTAADLAALPAETRLMASRALACMAIWHEDHGLLWDPDSADDGATTGDLAAFIGIKPMTPERRDLETALTALRKAGCLHFEFRARVDLYVRWWLTPRGLEVARKLPIGRTGFERTMPS